MKTLDELIVELESYPVVGETTLTFDVIVVPERSLNDALHYLKEYRDYAKAVDERREHEIIPLSYEELQALEQGTPILIEYGKDFEDGDIYLVIYCLEKINRFVVSDKTGERQEFECDKYGKTWRAYMYRRKDV